MTLLYRLCAIVIVTFWVFAARAEQGVTPDSVTFAQVAVLEGPSAMLGTSMQQGLLAAFDEVNRAGGVHGRRVLLESFDDGYEPGKSAAHTRRIIAADAHLGLIGTVGTPTNQAIVPLAIEADWPVVAPVTGAAYVRNPDFHNVFNIRASYAEESEIWATYLVDHLGLTRVAVIYQDDGFGRSGLDGLRAALERRDLTLVASGSYTRNTIAVKSALLDIRSAEPEAVVIVGLFRPVAEFIRRAITLDMKPVYVTLSFVSADALLAEIGAAGEGLVMSQVVPFPWDDSRTVVAQYQAALAAADPDAKPGFVSLEGYIAGRVAIEALKAAGPDLTRESYMQALTALGQIDLDGVTVSFLPDQPQGMGEVFLTRITGNSFEPVEM